MSVLSDFIKRAQAQRRKRKQPQNQQFKPMSFDPKVIDQNLYRYIKQQALPAFSSAEQVLFYLSEVINMGVFDELPDTTAESNETFGQYVEMMTKMVDEIVHYLKNRAGSALERMVEKGDVPDDAIDFDSIASKWDSGGEDAWRDYLNRIGNPFEEEDLPDVNISNYGPAQGGDKQYVPNPDSEKWETLVSRPKRRKGQELRNETVSGETEQPSSQSVDDPANKLEFVDRIDQKKNRVPGPHGDSLNKSARYYTRSEMIELGEKYKKDFASLPESEKHKLRSRGLSPEEHLNYFHCAQTDDEHEPKFKIGDRIVDATDADVPKRVFRIVGINACGNDSSIPFHYNYEIEEEGIDPPNNKHPDGYPWLMHEKYAAPAPLSDLEGNQEVVAVRNPFHVAQEKETGHDAGELSDHETVESGHIGGNFDPSSSYNGGGRTPGKLDNPTINNRVQHDTEYDAKHDQITS